MTKTNIVSIENQYYNQYSNYVLRSPGKGKIYKGPYHNAYNRESLGSIPRKIENVLFKDNLCENKYGFNSQTVRFSSEPINSSMKLNTDMSKTSTTKDSISISNNASYLLSSPSIGSKGYGVGFASKANRFSDDYESYINKYKPGPGENSNSLGTIADRSNKSLNYRSLHYNRKSKQIFTQDDTPGPGDYNLRANLINNNSHNSYNWSSCFAVPLEEKNLKTTTESIQLTDKQEEKITECVRTQLLKNSKSDPKSKQQDAVSVQKEETAEIDKVSFKRRLDKILKTQKFSFVTEADVKKSAINRSFTRLRASLSENKSIPEANKGSEQLEHKVGMSQSEREFHHFADTNLSKMYLGTSKGKGSKQKLTSRKEDDFYLRYKQINLKPSHYFLSQSPKSSGLNANHNPGPSYYSAFKLPDHLSFNVYNSLFLNNVDCQKDKKWI